MAVEPRIPTTKFIPSAIVSRKRQSETFKPLELTSHIPTFVCSIQSREIAEPVPNDPPIPSFGSLSFRYVRLPVIAKSFRWTLLPEPMNPTRRDAVLYSDPSPTNVVYHMPAP